MFSSGGDRRTTPEHSEDPLDVSVSVVIPMFNGAATVRRAIASLRVQVAKNWEAIVVDDGSTDDGAGAAIVQEEAGRDQRVKLMCQANGGVCRARNRGLDAARGRYVLMLDADDWMLPGGVDALLNAAEKGRSGGAVGLFEMVGDARSPADGTERVLSVEGPWSDEIAHHHLLGGIFMTTHGHLVERRFYAHPTPLRFDESLPLIEDTDAWIRLAERGVRWRNCHKAVGGYLMRPDSRSVKFASMLEWTVRVYANAYARADAMARAGTLPADVDHSRERLARLLGHAAIGYATRVAISGDGEDRIHDAAALVKATPGIVATDGPRLGRAARHAVMFALGAPPSETNRDAPWRARLRAWWQRCEAEGWAPAGSAQDAERSLLDQAPLPAARGPVGNSTGSVGPSGPGVGPQPAQMAQAAQPAPVFGR